MKKIPFKTVVLSMFIISLTTSATAQALNHKALADSCDGPIYKGNEVSRRATFITLPNPELTDEARANLVRGRVVLRAVLCHTGQVTDIQVVEGLPFGVTERGVEAARETEFTPAEREGQVVSQVIKFEFRFSYIGERRPLAKWPLEGRMIDSVEVGGYNEQLKDKVNECMGILSGQLYSEELIEDVRQRLLRLEDFDGEASSVRIEESDLGGLGVVFEIKKRSKD